MKKIIWQGSSKKDVISFPVDARRRAGYELFNVQSGEEPSDWKSMHGIGRGVKEIRIHLKNEYRIIYVAQMEDAIYVLHAFVKKTQKTPKKDLEIAKVRYQEIMPKHRR